MGYNKAVDSAKLDADILSIADAIRAKGGTDAPLEFPQGMVDAVNAIQAGEDTTQEDGLIDGTLVHFKNDRVSEIKTRLFNDSRNLQTAESNTVVIIGSVAFSGSKSLTDARFPACKETNGASFNDCISLVNADFRSLEDCGDNDFKGCALTGDINFRKLKRLQWRTFRGSKFNKIEFDQLSEMKNQEAFYGNRNLVAFINRSPVMCVLGNINNFTDTLIASGTGYIYVPKALVEQYKAAPNWSVYAAQIRAIEDYPEITGGAQ